jgi:hypothetical protein
LGIYQTHSLALHLSEIDNLKQPVSSENQHSQKRLGPGAWQLLPLLLEHEHVQENLELLPAIFPDDPRQQRPNPACPDWEKNHSINIYQHNTVVIKEITEN